MTGRALDHVGIAVHSLDESLPLFESITGGKGHGRETVEQQGVEVVFLGSGDGLVAGVHPDRVIPGADSDAAFPLILCFPNPTSSCRS